MDTKTQEQIKHLKKINKKAKAKESKLKWVLQITVVAFIISFSFSFISETTLPNVSLWIGILVLIAFILLGVLFDMIGVAVTASEEKPFHSMSARKIRGASMAITLKKNADKVSSFCNDVIGDICGIVSGSAGVIIASTLAKIVPINVFLLTLLVTAFIAACTIGGKALAKRVAIERGNYILYEFAKVLSYLYKGKK